MSEFETIQQTTSFQSKKTVINQLHNLGIKAGDNLIVHSSLKSMGWIAGGAQAVVEALMEAVTTEGTIVMPAQSPDNSEPSYWMVPPVPEDWYEPIRQSFPAYDPHLTHLREMGKIADCFHRHPSTIRSNHPAHSFMAWGKHAKDWMSEHPLEDSFGTRSPLGKMMDTDVKIVMIGVGYDSCTALHLAEYLAPGLTTSPQGSAIMQNGQRVWATYDMADVDSDIFPEIGMDFEKSNPTAATCNPIGQADCKVVSMQDLLVFGTEWIEKSRKESLLESK
ncbi:AAC(3) family N-acetyltransferase [Filibacter tadaridae]|uniref:Aminoglycoside N(3)-acetyltransferase n=1 Tax=Filibacter tadaridae TaxID=2483811 RepID=A0A3P5WL77_9BACL|nr:AAC(3) family N-acetyltransferase [Filibacter tadaridae]VDC21632.1 SPBc2 prophage-derived aminoglycoside N(3')-acetyltransferase-like protein YokD [Filibacter tadaridae]